jgi:mono/diheme cytochrome c family protein
MHPTLPLLRPQPAAVPPTTPAPVRVRSLRRHDLPAIKHSARRTLAAMGLVLLASASTGLRAHGSPAAAPPLIERGRYLVENVGLCADCHTPRTEKGEFDRTRWLVGAALPFAPTVPMPWVPAAPPIAGLPSMTDAQAVTFLKTGRRPDGSLPRPPMPEFRLNDEDAQAVVAYLRSVAK